ncbi:MAG: hypothetical protein A2143_05570 [Gallionellales bacterium RBG_16_57_15]|nr:MAG: hypothetical protein A2143_05570 [Gallionellales bacterium RBG_16_57_15]
MSMISEIEYALMAGGSYISTRPEINQFPIPQGWVSFNHQSLDTGFEAVTFTNGSEIVISFAGTGPFGDGDWLNGNIPLALGALPSQLKQAADYYLQVKALNPDAAISFTGHSLGGGLASLMAVMFNENAVTFDQAPFRNSALTYTTTDPDTGIVTTHSVAQDLLTYLSGEVDQTTGQPIYSASQLQGLTNFINASVADSGVIPNESNVTDINVQGEVLSYLTFSRIGSEADITQQNDMLFPQIDLHSQALLTAFLQSNQTADANKALNDVTFKHTDLLKMIFDSALFYNDPNNTDPEAPANLLEHLVQQQAAASDPALGEVTRFTTDLWKLAQDGGLTMSDGYTTNPDLHALSNALIAFDMQKYYTEQTGSVGAGQTLFTDLSTAGTGSNGIQFDTAAVVGTGNSITGAKGYQYFAEYLKRGEVIQNGEIFTPGIFSTEEQALINAMLPALRDWYAQAGVSGMLATDTLNRGAFMLGGTGQDILTGGAKADLLVGNTGDDTLTGGGGSDVLIGGAGVDTYVWQAGLNAGIDTILDTDNTGYLRDDTGAPSSSPAAPSTAMTASTVAQMRMEQTTCTPL